MEFIVDNKIQEIDTIIDALFVNANMEELERTYNHYNLRLLPNEKDFLKEIESKVDKEKLNYFFKEYGGEVSIAKAMYSTKTLYGKTLEESLDFIRDEENSKILESLVADMLFLKFGDRSIVRQKLIKKSVDKHYALEVLEESSIEPHLKWHIYMFINHIEEKKREFCNFIEAIYMEAKESIDRLLRESKKWSNDIKRSIEEEGLEYIKNTFKNIDIDDKAYDKVYIYVKALLSYNFQYVGYTGERELYIGFGVNYEKVLSTLWGRDTFQWFEVVAKCIADKEKFEIIKILSEEENYSLELSNRLGIATSDISNQIKNLGLSNLLIETKRNNKYYYSLNKDSLRSWIEVLIETLKL